MSLHSIQTKNHLIENWSFANATARLAHGLYVTADLGKLAYQQDNFTYWRLIQVTNPGSSATPTWINVGGSGGGSSGQVENGYLITSLSGVEATSLLNKDATGLPAGYKIIVTLNDSDAFYTLQFSAPNATAGDVGVKENGVLNSGKRWRQTGGF